MQYEAAYSRRSHRKPPPGRIRSGVLPGLFVIGLALGDGGADLVYALGYFEPFNDMDDNRLPGKVSQHSFGEA